MHDGQREAGPPREIRTIFCRPHFAGETWGGQNRYLLEAKEELITVTNSSDKRPAKQFIEETDDITFNKRDDGHHVCYPHYDELVIKAMITNNNVHRMLVDNGSSIDILYFQAFERIGLKVSDLRPSPNPIYSFTGQLSP